MGWQMASHMRTPLVTEALGMAINHGRIAPDALFHAGRGSQYTPEEFQKYCQKKNIRQSLGRTGVCWDNAVAESSFTSMKNEMYYHQVFPTRARARFAVRDYIEVFSNRPDLPLADPTVEAYPACEIRCSSSKATRAHAHWCDSLTIRAFLK